MDYLRSIGKVINDYEYLVAPFMTFIFVISNYGRLIIDNFLNCFAIPFTEKCLLGSLPICSRQYFLTSPHVPSWSTDWLKIYMASHTSLYIRLFNIILAIVILFPEKLAAHARSLRGVLDRWGVGLWRISSFVLSLIGTISKPFVIFN